MKTNKLLVKSLAGLANRMRVIDSAITLSKKLDMHLVIIWNKDRNLNCNYNDLFQPMEEFSVEASWYDNLRNRIRPWESISFIFRDRMSLKISLFDHTWLYDTHPSFLQHYNFDRLKKMDYIYISTAHRFKEPDYIPLFKPIPEVFEKIETACSEFTEKTYGLHIRRSDSKPSITNSPDILFIDKINELLQLDPETNFFLATDDRDVKTRFSLQFGERIITRDNIPSRNTVVGIQDALIDLYSLSRTKKIFGSFFSSFSDAASQISGVGIEILQEK
jgi:hypothetical protein